MFCVGVFIIEFWHCQRSSAGKESEPRGNADTPEATEDEGPADGLDSIQSGYHHLSFTAYVTCIGRDCDSGIVIIGADCVSLRR